MAEIAGTNSAGGLLETLRPLATGNRAPLAQALASTRVDAVSTLVRGNEEMAEAGFTSRLPTLISESLSLRADTFLTLATPQETASSPDNAFTADGANAPEGAASRAEAAGPLSSSAFADLFEAATGDRDPTAGEVAGNFLDAARLI